MADITDRVRNRAKALFEPGEHVIAALLVEPKGTYGAASIAIAALPRTSVRRIATSAHEVARGDGGLAATFPKGSCVLVVTDQRIAVIPSNGIGMKEITAAYDRTDLAVTGNVGKGLGRRSQLTFIDGTGLTVDAQRGQPFDVFASAIG